MRYLIREHQSKEVPYAEALRGHEPSRDVVLIDFDRPHPAYDGWREHAQRIGAALVIYPHGFSPVMIWALIGGSVKADLAFVPGPGQKYLLETYGYPNPIEVIGWPGPRKAVEPRKVERVLFAPHHPLGSGYMQPDCREANAEAFRCLLDEPFELAVRHVGTLKQNGLWHVDGVDYVQGNMGDGTLHVADVVVAGGTYAAECLVRGVPVVMYDQDREWRLESEHGPEVAYAPDWRRHRSYTRYPYDLAPGVCQEAAESPDVTEWCERFLGPVFDPQAFVRLIEETLNEPALRR